MAVNVFSCLCVVMHMDAFCLFTFRFFFPRARLFESLTWREEWAASVQQRSNIAPEKTRSIYGCTDATHPLSVMMHSSAKALYECIFCYLADAFVLISTCHGEV